MRRDLLIQVPAAHAGERLDRVLQALHPDVPRAGVVAAFAEGRVSVAGHAVAKGCRARAGELLRVEGGLPDPADALVRAVPGPLAVVYEDDALLAFDKPGGQNCHPLEPAETGTLLNAMLARYPALAAVGGDPRMPALLHRIDAGTSGLVLAARTDAAFEDIRRQFLAQTVLKTYLALVEGRVETPGGIAGYLAHMPGDRGRMRVVSRQTAPRGERALRAETFYRPLRGWAGQTLLDVTIRTGVTHQIRCQLASIGHPVCGDCRYGAAPCVTEATERHFLHAAAIALRHPLTGRALTLRVPLSGDLERWLTRLGDGRPYGESPQRG